MAVSYRVDRSEKLRHARVQQRVLREIAAGMVARENQVQRNGR